MGEWTGPLYRTVDPFEASGNPFADAAFYTGQTQDFVFNQLQDIKNIFDDSESYLRTVLDKLDNFEVDFQVLSSPPDRPTLDFDFTPDFQPIDPAVQDRFGQVSPPNFGPAPNTGSISSITVPTIPSFSPSIVGLAIPDPPPSSSIPTPGDAPGAPTLEFPPAPTITLPDLPQLAQITIPTFAGITLPTFDPTFPQFAGAEPNTAFDWTEPLYSREIIDSAIAQIEVFLAGGSGINPVVEEALVARGREREDRLVRQNEEQATGEFANRGYTAPPGMLVQRIDAIREDGLLKKLGLQREVVLKVHEDELTNLRFAVQQGIAAEQLFVELFLASTQRLFEAQRLTIQWTVDLYNMSIALFNAKMQEVQIRAQVYEVQVRAALAEVEVFKVQVEAELAKSEVNKSLVEAYKAEIEARESLVRIYEVQIRAIGERANVYATEIQAYRGTIEAYAAQVAADKTRFDAYDSRVRGELGKASIVESEARAYQAEISGIDTGVRAQSEAVRGQVAKIQADISAYEANVRGQIGRAQIEIQNIEKNVRGFEADVRRYAAELGLEESRNRVEVAAWESALRGQIEYFRSQIAEYDVDLRALAKEAELSLQGIQATGQLSSTISAGALAAMHVGATLSGNSGTTATGQDSVSWAHSFRKSCDRSTDVNISVSADEVPDTSCPF